MTRRVSTSIIASFSLIFFSVSVASAWTGPSASFPNGNVAAPLNVGTVSQIKNGTIGVNGISVFGNSLLYGSGSGGNAYLNFGTTAGSSGYGIYDNAGTLQFKNSGGSWQSLQSIISTLCGGGSCSGESGLAMGPALGGTSPSVGAGAGFGVTSATQSFAVPSNAAYVDVRTACNSTSSYHSWTAIDFYDASNNDLYFGNPCYSNAGQLSQIQDEVIPVPANTVTMRLRAAADTASDNFTVGSISVQYYGSTAPTGTYSTQWATNGSSISYNSGNVGIGTANPIQKLDVTGNVNVSGDVYVGSRGMSMSEAARDDGAQYWAPYYPGYGYELCPNGSVMIGGAGSWSGSTFYAFTNAICQTID
jgi:hypothetical protein